jgi:hypothetical protein
MSVALVWIVVFAILVVLALATRDFKWRCPAPGCDFKTGSEEEAQKHAAAHAKHKPVWKEPY